MPGMRKRPVRGVLAALAVLVGFWSASFVGPNSAPAPAPVPRTAAAATADAEAETVDVMETAEEARGLKVELLEVSMGSPPQSGIGFLLRNRTFQNFEASVKTLAIERLLSPFVRWSCCFRAPALVTTPSCACVPLVQYGSWEAIVQGLVFGTKNT